MKYLLGFSRIFVGSLFIISGLIKANDPLGFSYKLQEYFAESALGLPFLEPYALALGMLACLAEIVLGFAVLFGGKMKIATWALVGLTVFFAWLTLYTATCDPQGVYMAMEDGVQVEKTVTCVTDCGCFGDAMKGSIGRSLTPWESFYKDLLLFIFILPIFFVSVFGKGISLNTEAQDKIYLPLGLVGVAFFSWVFTWYFPIIFALIIYAGYLLIKRYKDRSDWLVAGWVALATIIFMWVCYTYLPVRDYRAYAVGENLPHNRLTAEELGLEPTITYNTYTLVKEGTGEEMTLESDVYMKEKWWEKKEWKINKDLTKGPFVRKYGYETPIPDFSVMSTDGYYKEDTLLNNPKPVLILCTYDVTTAEASIEEVAALCESAAAAGYDVFGLSASPADEIEVFRHAHQLAFPYYNGDEKVIKTIVRSNPGLILLKQGTVMGKWSKAQIPSMEELKSAYK
jgi:uncharacterized membrane protein YphA (DoxX/SURF4 family)